MINSDFADAHYPADSSGNIYRGLHLDDAISADLSDMSDNPDPALADPTPYREHFFKRTNSSEDDWSDLIGLTQSSLTSSDILLDCELIATVIPPLELMLTTSGVDLRLY